MGGEYASNNQIYIKNRKDEGRSKAFFSERNFI